MNRETRHALVTGGAGFIGSRLTRRLLKDGWRVTVIDDLSSGRFENLIEHKNLTKVKTSITQKSISRFFKNIDVVFHLAALPLVQQSIENPRQTHDVHINGTLNLLLLARDHKINKFIFSSSFLIYGQQTKLPFTEDLTPFPMSPYALHKRVGEEYCQLFYTLWGLPTITLRYFNVYGPGMDSDGATSNIIPKFIKTMSQNKIPVINGDGEQKRDFIHVDDVIEANILAANSPLAGEIFDIGSGKNISLNKVVKLINKFMGKNIKPIHGPAIIEPTSTLASFTKAKRLLGWQPEVNFQEGLKMMLGG